MLQTISRSAFDLGAAPQRPRAPEGTGSPSGRACPPPQAAKPDPDDESESEEAAERPEREGERFDARPAGQIVDDICRGLDLDPALARSIRTAFEEQESEGGAAPDEAPAAQDQEPPPVRLRSTALRGHFGPDPPGASP